MLIASGITPEHAALRGYETVTDTNRLAQLNIVRPGRRTPGLLVPMLRSDGSTWGYQYRPDDPRLRDGKPVKYETPWQQRNGIDVPPGVGDQLGDPAIPLLITEGVKKADCGVLHGLCIVGLVGVWNWLHTNSAGGKMALPEWRDIALNGRRVVLAFDGDVARKEPVQKAMRGLAAYLATKDARIEYLWLPDTDDKTGLDDYLSAGNSVEDLWRLVKPIQQAPAQPKPPEAPKRPAKRPVTPVGLDNALSIFCRWLHLDDTAPVLAVAAAVVANLAPGDPVWLLVVGPPSGGKTEILQSLSPFDYVVPAATVTEAALLSGTSQRERARDATGGLLRQVGDFGILLAKDFTSVLSQNRDTAKAAMAALREVYDGNWHRPVGTDGGRVLTWSGKCGFLGGVTPSYDRYGAIVNALGDRYLLLRLPDVDPDKQSRAALAQAEHEKTMRAELAAAMTGLIASADQAILCAPLTEQETNRLVSLASFTARARTAVERDGYSGELLVLPQPEGPARVIKALRRVYGALGAIGADDDDRWQVLTRIAVDCVPAVRTPVMRELLANPEPRRTSAIAASVGLVTKTAHRLLDDLALLEIAERTKKTEADNSPDLWTASEWLRSHANEVGQKNTIRRVGVVKEGSAGTSDTTNEGLPNTAPRTFPSHFRAGICDRCATQLEQPESLARGRCAECALTQGGAA
ncbi:DUF3854 domain-containing protein [Mycobacterium marinum]|uniref:DUF3854 domain-containing protein n=1 Tax=Mycobacterium marinum TaxID=1781 RepID=UPI003564DB9F